MASRLRPIAQQDMSKGMNLVTNPYIVGAKQGLLYTNLLLDEHGSLRVRDGTLIAMTSPDTTTKRPIVKMWHFIHADGTHQPLVLVRGLSGNNELYDATVPATWVSISALGTKYELPDMLPFLAQMLIANGYEVPYKYDGTTLAHITSSTGTVPGGAKHQTLHQGYHFLWNTAAVSGTLDGPSSLRSGDLNSVTSYPAANQIFIDKDDGEPGMGMGQFTIAESGISPSTSQILFKTYSAYQMTGVFGSTAPAFAVQRIKSDMGCLAPRSIHFAPGFGLIRLSHRGFALFDGVDDKLISEEVRPLLFGSLGYVGIDWTNVALSSAELVPNPPLYICACPIAGAALARIFVFDLVRQAWTVLQYPQNIASFYAHEDPDALPVMYAGDYDAGHIRALFSGAADDDGTPINWQAALRPAPGSSPQQPAYFRRAVIKVAGGRAGQTLNAQAIFGPLTQTIATEVDRVLTLGVTGSLAPLFGYGLDAYSTGAYGGGGGGNNAGLEQDLTMDLGVIGNNARLNLSGQGQLTLRGIEWHVRPKPIGRGALLG
jgi:hypothetical protein